MGTMVNKERYVRILYGILQRCGKNVPVQELRFLPLIVCRCFFDVLSPEFEIMQNWLKDRQDLMQNYCEFHPIRQIFGNDCNLLCF